MELKNIHNSQNVWSPKNSSFKIHRFDGYISNLFLIEYEHGLLLLDCGAIGDIKRIEKYCFNILKCSPAEIKLAIVTHMHPDHSGAAVLLRKKYGIPIAAHNEVDLWYKGISGVIQQTLDCYMMQIVARRIDRKLEKSLFDKNIKPDYPLKDFQQLPFFSDWKAVHVPGHTLHDIVLYNEKAKVIYVSDCLCDVKGKLQLPLPVIFYDQMKESFKKMASLDCTYILLAHGNTVYTENSSVIFDTVSKQLDNPPTKVMRQVYKLSVFTPEVKKRIKMMKEEKKSINF